MAPSSPAPPLRVVYVLAEPELAGGNKVIFQHASLLARRGHVVDLVGEGPAPGWFDLPVPWHDLGRGVPDLGPRDLAVATYWTTIVRARELAAQRGWPVVAHFCQGFEGDLEHLAPRRGEIEAAYGLDLPTLVVSPHLARLLEERFGRRCRVAPPPLDERFRPRLSGLLGVLDRRPRRGRPWIAVPGIYEAPVKGVPTALEAAKLLIERSARDGRGPLSLRLLRFSSFPLSEAETALYGSPERYLHGVPPAVVARELRRCDLLLLPSRDAEGFGLPALEAMASGVPVVASDIPSVQGFAGDAVARVAPGDAEAFAAAAHRLLTDGAAWRAAREAGLERSRRFAPERVAAAVEEALAWAAASGGRSPSAPSEKESA